MNADGAADLVVHDSVRPPDQTASLAVLLGRDDGSFRPEQVFRSPISPNSHWPDVALGDVNRDGNLDVAVVGDLEPAGGRVLLGDGAGRFAEGPKLPLVGFGVELVDLNGDGLLDAVSVNKYDNTVQYALGKGDGTFAAAQAVAAGQSPIALAIADIGSPVKDSKQLGPPDGRPDIVVANSGISQPSFSGPAELVVLLATEDKDQAFAGFAAPIRLAGGEAPQDVDVHDVNGDGTLDVVAVDSGSLLVVYGRVPQIAANDTPETARDLGVTFHSVQPTETIVPAHADDYFVFTVPSEPARGAGDQVVDISALFQFQDGPGLAMEVRDSRGVLRGAGERVRMAAAQGEQLLIHVFGQEDAGGTRGTGTFTLVINVLPQLVAVSADALLPGIGTQPGGPSAILVLTLQGDRLEPDTAENPANYTVAFLGPDGLPGTADDEVLPVRDVVYNPDANVDVSSGQTIPAAVRQTVTLLFDRALPPGSYAIEISPDVQATPFNSAEPQLVAAAGSFGFHPLVSNAGGPITAGVEVVAADLVRVPGALGDLTVFENGTSFLTQFHNDLGALADAILKRLGDEPVTAEILEHILSRIAPSLGELGQRPTSLLVHLSRSGVVRAGRPERAAHHLRLADKSIGEQRAQDLRGSRRQRGSGRGSGCDRRVPLGLGRYSRTCPRRGGAAGQQPARGGIAHPGHSRRPAEFRISSRRRSADSHGKPAQASLRWTRFSRRQRRRRR